MQPRRRTTALSFWRWTSGVSATFACIDDGTPLAANESKLRYRMRDQQIKFATDAFFF